MLTGGLGGLGMALGVWLAQRGARHLLLTSKRGLRTGAQARALRDMRECGATVRAHPPPSPKCCRQVSRSFSAPW